MDGDRPGIYTTIKAMKKKMILLGTIAAALLNAGEIRCQYREQPATLAAFQPSEGTPARSKSEFLAERLRIPAAEIEELRGKNVSWDDLVPLLVISKWAREKSEAVWAQKQSGLSWRKIAETYNLDDKAVDEEVHAIRTSLDAIQETIELPPLPRGGNPARPDKPY